MDFDIPKAIPNVMDEMYIFDENIVRAYELY